MSDTSNTVSTPSWVWVLQKLSPLLALLAVIVVFAVADNMQEDGGTFLTARNLQVVLAQTAVFAVAALGMTLIIISGGIDLSAGTGLVLAGAVLASCLENEYSVAVAVTLCLMTGCLSGFINGVLIS